METSYFEYLHEQMEHNLRQIRDAYETPAEWAIKSIPVVQKCLAELKEHILEHPFTRRSEEIEFFKRMKPTITSQLIFLTEVFNWWNDRIVEDNPNKQRRYWADKRKLIRAYFRKQVVLYSYLVNDYQWLDVQFFVRRQRATFYYWGIPNELDPVCFLSDPEFSTSHDHRVAKIIAYKMLDEFCRQQLIGSAGILNRYRSNSSLSKRIRKEIKQFRLCGRQRMRMLNMKHAIKRMLTNNLLHNKATQSI